MASKTYSEKYLIDYCKDYETRKDLKATKEGYRVYETVKNRKLQPIAFAHMINGREPLSEEVVMRRAKTFDNYHNFSRKSGGAYGYAKANDLLDKVRAIYPVEPTTLEKMIARGREAFGDKYDYSEAVYIDKFTNVRILCPDHGAFEQLAHNHGKSGCPKCAVGRKSKPETQLADFIAQFTDVRTSVRDVVRGVEIDIYLPAYKLGFEFNGLYWHSSGSETPRDYHQTKTDLAEMVGVRLVHIWEDEWRDNRKWVENYIKNLIGISRKIGARKTTIRTPTNAEAKAFHIEHHLQGHREGSHYGLYLNDALVAVATTAKTTKGELELARWTVCKGWVIQGGLSKICKAINKPMITFCDTAKHDGAGFEKAGFSLVSEGSVTYWYTDSKERFNRIGFQKHKLEAKGAKGSTEKEMAASLGYHQIGGCSQKKYALGLSDSPSLPFDDARHARIVKHREKKTQRAFSDADLLKIAKGHQTRTALQKADGSAYKAIANRGLKAEAFAHMKVIRRKWTDGEVIAELSQYENIGQVRKNNNALFIQAYRRGLTDAINKPSFTFPK